MNSGLASLANPLQLMIKSISREFSLPEALVGAITSIESSGDVYSWKPEPPYRYLFDVVANKPFRPITALEIASEIPPADFRVLKGDRTTEWWGQQASWGPMQLMGAVAREVGFTANFPALCDTLQGTRYGCKHLASLRNRFLAQHGWRGVVAAYNAGSPRFVGSKFVNQSYVDKATAAGAFVGIA